MGRSNNYLKKCPVCNEFGYWDIALCPRCENIFKEDLYNRFVHNRCRDYMQLKTNMPENKMTFTEFLEKYKKSRKDFNLFNNIT